MARPGPQPLLPNPSPATRPLPARHENAETFLDLMKERFLRGEEVGVDYPAIDADASLDDDWLDQRGQDAEDAYFDKD